MCSFMLAYHNCDHYRQWFARCFIAKEREAQVCGMDSFPTWQYQEQFPCPACGQQRKREVMTLLSIHQPRDNKDRSRATPDSSVHPRRESQQGGTGAPRGSSAEEGSMMDLRKGSPRSTGRATEQPTRGWLLQEPLHAPAGHRSPRPTVAEYPSIPHTVSPPRHKTQGSSVLMADRPTIHPPDQPEHAQPQYGAPVTYRTHQLQADTAAASKERRAYSFGYQLGLDERAKRDSAFQR